MPLADHLPGEQLEQLLLPTSLHCPASHLAQARMSIALFSLPKRPAGHALQCISPAPLKVPATQSTQSPKLMAPPCEPDLPAGQSIHSNAPALPFHFPGGHKVQPFELPTLVELLNRPGS